MGVSGSWLAAVLAAAVLSGCAEALLARPEFPVEAPVWGPGMSWTYTWTMSTWTEGAEGRTEQQGKPQEATVRVLAPATANGQPGWLLGVEKGRMPVLLPWSLGIPVAATKELLFAPAGGPVFDRVVVDTKACRLQGDCAAAGEPFEAKLRESAPVPAIPFPLEEGRSWDIHPAQAALTKLPLEGDVVASHRATVPAGRLPTVLLGFGIDAAALEAMLAEEAKQLQARGLPVPRIEAAYEARLEHAPQARAIVAADVVLERRTWPDPQKDPETSTAGGATLHLELTKSSLAPEPALDGRGLLAWLGQSAVVKPTVPTLPRPPTPPTPAPLPQPQALRIMLEQPVDANAAEAPQATWTLFIPEGQPWPQEPLWFVQAPDGQMASHIGRNVSAAIDMAGTYWVRVVDGAAGSPYAPGEAQLRAHWSSSGSGSCGPAVALAAVGSCDALEWRIGNGTRDIVAFVELPSALQDGRLRLLDGAGAEHAWASFSSGRALIEAPMGAGGLGTWVLHVDPPTGAGADFTYVLVAA